MPYAEFLEWIAYSRIEPFGEERADWRAASVVAMLANINRDAKKRRKPYPVSDFLLNFEPIPAQSLNDQLAFVEMLNIAFGGEDRRPQAATSKADE